MKNIILVAFLLVRVILSAQVTIKVEVKGLKSNKGQVMIGLYNSEKDFLKKTYKGTVVLIKDKIATVTFSNIPKGEYAVSLFHDENNNGKLDSNFMGIPREDYAASNGAKGFMGPPKYKDAKFSISENKTILLKI
jgi:uncharacterized protein (DUF2141 family)